MVEKRSLRTVVAKAHRHLLSRPLVTLAVAAGLVAVAVASAVVVAQIAHASAVPSTQQAVAVRLVQPRRSLMAGTVESVAQSANSFSLKTLRGATVTVAVNDATHYRKLGSGASSFAAPVVGTHVIVVVTKTTAGSLLARTVWIVPKGVALARPAVRRSLMAGTVESVSSPAANSFSLKTLRGATVTVAVNDATHYRKLGSGASNFGALVVGTHVVVVTTRIAAGSLLAKRVLIVPKRLAGRMRRLRGVLSPQLRSLRASGLATAAQI